MRQALRKDDLSCLVLYGAGLLHGANQYPPILKTRATAHSNPASDFAFRDCMVVTLQPQLTTRDRRIGLQFGETVVIRPRGVARLHCHPREMIVV